MSNDVDRKENPVLLVTGGAEDEEASFTDELKVTSHTRVQQYSTAELLAVLRRWRKVAVGGATPWGEKREVQSRGYR